MAWSGARCRQTDRVMAAGPAVLPLMSASSIAAGQQASIPIDSRAELRLFSADSMDIAAGKQLCADCHGAEGISSIGNMPNLAGQRAAYLHREMRAYLMGARAMTL